MVNLFDLDISFYFNIPKYLKFFCILKKKKINKIKTNKMSSLYILILKFTYK